MKSPVLASQEEARMVFLRNSIARAVFLLTVCVASRGYAQGTQGGSEQAPPVRLPQTHPLEPRPLPRLEPPVLFPAPIQGKEGATGEIKPFVSPAPLPSGQKQGEHQNNSPLPQKRSLAGCIVVGSDQQYRLLTPSGTAYNLIGKTTELRAGSAVEVEGFLSAANSQTTSTTAPEGNTSSGSFIHVFSVTSVSLLSRSCQMRSPSAAHAAGLGGIIGALGGGPGRQGAVGEPRLSAGLGIAPAQPPSPQIRVQTALRNLKAAERELKAAGAPQGSQAELALRSVQVAISNLELAVKKQK